MPAIPNTEPLSFTAGETVQWTRVLPDYPAGTWTLKYALQAPGKSLITLTAGADGTTHAITIAAATSGAWAPGVYLATAYVEQGSTLRAIGRFSVSIFASPLAALGETHAVQMLRLIEAALVGRIPRGLETTNIDGQELQRIPFTDLHALRDKYRVEVQAEATAAAAAAGIRKRRTIGIRFVRPS